MKDSAGVGNFWTKLENIICSIGTNYWNHSNKHFPTVWFPTSLWSWHHKIFQLLDFPTTLFKYTFDYFELTLSRNCFSAMTLIFFLSWAAVNRNYEQLSVFVHFGCRILAVCQSNWLKFIFVTRLSGIGFCQHYRNDADLHCCLLNLPQIET